jgi:hypothetical protein
VRVGASAAFGAGLAAITGDDVLNGALIAGYSRAYNDESPSWLDSVEVFGTALEAAAIPQIVGTGKSTVLVAKGLKKIIKFLGPGAKGILNRSDDLILLSKDKLRRVRFDINNPFPHKSPHGHVEFFNGNKWKQLQPKQIYPKNVLKE